MAIWVALCPVEAEGHQRRTSIFLVLSSDAALFDLRSRMIHGGREPLP
jgi:hypothetical protein